MLCFSDIIAIKYISLLVPDRQELVTEQWNFPRSVKKFLILGCCNSNIVNGKMLRVFSKKGFFSHHYLRLSSIRVVLIPNERESVVFFIYKLFETIKGVQKI